MMKDWLADMRCYLVTGYTDMRKQIDGLYAIIAGEFDLDPFDSGSVFLFCGRQATKLKALVWEGDGFCLLYKRLDVGGRFKWPRSKREAMELTPQQIRWLLEGLEIEQKKAIQPVDRVEMF